VQQPRKIVPPVYLLASMGLMYVLDRWMPIAEYLPESLKFLAAVFLAVGLVMIFTSFGLFVKADTGVVPFSEAKALVTSGFYRITRNPMYLGMLFILVGAAFKFGSLGALLPLPAFVAVIHYNFILGEEVFLEEAFGKEFLDYKNRVRRWL
jgi:protein-S-isoprenylcysteine O-methyltransferase Ste14